MIFSRKTKNIFNINLKYLTHFKFHPKIYNYIDMNFYAIVYGGDIKTFILYAQTIIDILKQKKKLLLDVYYNN